MCILKAEISKNKSALIFLGPPVRKNDINQRFILSIPANKSYFVNRYEKFKNGTSKTVQFTLKSHVFKLIFVSFKSILVHFYSILLNIEDF